MTHSLIVTYEDENLEEALRKLLDMYYKFEEFIGLLNLLRK